MWPVECSVFLIISCSGLSFDGPCGLIEPLTLTTLKQDSIARIAMAWQVLSLSIEPILPYVATYMTHASPLSLPALQKQRDDASIFH